ncbi:uncharacterized protein LOC104582437 [Brachypodium distachyon]|uniref:uncharacterized protein LOC104582437 n=1 Tax=Brachypodium distachyon TaxID=15368 RepID=UPI000D0D6DED|nr:uncharacterized protein LOC104582437 [Brachypodium distachyon]|eukprot:XP_024315019.1 uncharacterized protein LOC104582437 [Brachypodium distachyon]
MFPCLNIVYVSNHSKQKLTKYPRGFQRNYHTMDARHASMCFLVLFVLHGNPATMAGSCFCISLSLSLVVSCISDKCGYRLLPLSFCFDAMCKSECWIEGVALGAQVKEYECGGPGPKTYCICLFCQK